MGINFFFTFPTSEGSDLLSSHVKQTPTFISKLSDGNVIFRLDVGKKSFSYGTQVMGHPVHYYCTFSIQKLHAKKKWANLVRTYKSVKDFKKKTGRGSSRFLFFNKLDEILDENPTNASPHSFDVSRIGESDAEITHEPSTGTIARPRTSVPEENKLARKRSNPTTEYLKYKKQFYERKEQTLQEKRYEKKTFFEELLMLQREKNEIMKEKNKIEERKVTALEKLSAAQTS
jgi:hypothetical protein